MGILLWAWRQGVFWSDQRCLQRHPFQCHDQILENGGGKVRQFMLANRTNNVCMLPSAGNSCCESCSLRLYSCFMASISLLVRVQRISISTPSAVPRPCKNWETGIRCWWELLHISNKYTLFNESACNFGSWKHQSCNMHANECNKMFNHYRSSVVSLLTQSNSSFECIYFK